MTFVIAAALMMVAVAPQQSRPVFVPAQVPASMPASRPAEAAPTRSFPPLTDAERAFEESLNVRTAKVDFVALPAGAAVDWLEEFSGMPIRVDWESLAEIGLTQESPVSYHARDLELRHVVSGVFESICPHETLTHFVPSIWVTTIGPPLVTRCYPIDDILSFLTVWRARLALCPADHSPPGCEEEGSGPICNAVDPGQYALGATIITSIHPDAWEPNGGRGTLRFFGSTLVVRTSTHVHDDLARFLAGVRAAAIESGMVGEVSVPATASSSPTGEPERGVPFRRRIDVSEAAQQRHTARLSTRIPEVSFQEPPNLEGLLGWLMDYSSVPIFLDRSGLEDAGADLESPIDFNTRDLTLAECLGAALNHAQRNLELAFDVRPTGILITAADSVQLSTRIYVAADILLAYDAWSARRGLPTSQPASRPSGLDPQAWPPPAAQCLLAELLTSAVSPDEWDINGGTASVQILGPLLVVRMPYRTAKDPVEALLDALATSLGHR